MFFRHPSRRALREWLERDGSERDLETAGDADGAESAIDRHLETCQRCATVLEDIDTAEDLSLGDALALVYTPPDDLSDRLERRVVARLDSRVVLDMVSDLFGAGIETSKLLLTEDPTE